jgi:hypothetical protein
MPHKNAKGRARRTTAERDLPMRAEPRLQGESGFIENAAVGLRRGHWKTQNKDRLSFRVATKVLKVKAAATLSAISRAPMPI